jgi:hypothetical protein
MHSLEKCCGKMMLDIDTTAIVAKTTQFSDIWFDHMMIHDQSIRCCMQKSLTNCFCECSPPKLPDVADIDEEEAEAIEGDQSLDLGLPRAKQKLVDHLESLPIRHTSS